MDVDHFEELVHPLSPFLQKQDTNMRECISPEENLLCYVKIPCQWRIFISLEYQFRISEKAISYIVYKVVFAITQALGKEHLKTPKNYRRMEEDCGKILSPMEFSKSTWWC